MSINPLFTQLTAPVTMLTRRMQIIAKSVSFQKKIVFLKRLLAYWTMKRQERNGVPLLRRLQSTLTSKRSRDPVGCTHLLCVLGTKKCTFESTGYLKFEFFLSLTQTQVHKNKQESLISIKASWQIRRCDLEKARLLSELIRKREKQKMKISNMEEVRVCSLQINSITRIVYYSQARTYSERGQAHNNFDKLISRPLGEM